MATGSVTTLGTNQKFGADAYGPVSFHGQTGASEEHLLINSVEDGAVVTVYGTVETVDLPGFTGDFTFAAVAGQLFVYNADGTQLMARCLLPSDGSTMKIRLGDGSVEVGLDPATNAVSMGEQVLGNEAVAYTGALVEGDNSEAAPEGPGPDTPPQPPVAQEYTLQDLYANGVPTDPYIVTEPLELKVNEDGTAVNVADATAMKTKVANILAGADNADALDAASVVYTNFNVEDTPKNLNPSSAGDAVAGAGVVTAIGKVAEFQSASDPYSKPPYVTEVVVKDTGSDLDTMSAALSNVATTVVLEDSVDQVVFYMGLAGVRKLVNEVVVEDSLANIANAYADLNGDDFTVSSYVLDDDSTNIPLNGGNPLKIADVKTAMDTVAAILEDPKTEMADDDLEKPAVDSLTFEYKIVDGIEPVIEGDNSEIVGKAEDVLVVDNVANLTANTAYLGGMLVKKWAVQDTLKNIANAKNLEIFEQDSPPNADKGAQWVQADVSGDVTLNWNDGLADLFEGIAAKDYPPITLPDDNPNASGTYVIDITGMPNDLIPQNYFDNISDDFVFQTDGNPVEEGENGPEYTAPEGGTNEITLDVPAGSSPVDITLNGYETVSVSGDGPVTLVDKTGSVTSVSGNGSTSFVTSGDANGNVNITSFVNVAGENVSGSWDEIYGGGNGSGLFSSTVDLTGASGDVSIEGIKVDKGATAGSVLEITPDTTGSVTLKATESTVDLRFHAGAATKDITMVGGAGDDYIAGGDESSGSVVLVGNDGYDFLWGNASGSGSKITIFTGSEEESGSYENSKDSSGSGINAFAKKAFLNDGGSGGAASWYGSTAEKFSELLSTSNVVVVDKDSQADSFDVVFAEGVADTLLLRSDGSGLKSIIELHNFEVGKDKIAFMSQTKAMLSDSGGLADTFDLRWDNLKNGSGISVTNDGSGDTLVTINCSGSGFSGSFGSGSDSIGITLVGVEFTDALSGDASSLFALGTD